MAKQTINIGSSANDGTGDPLRTAFDKVNDNFNELYSATGAGSGQNISISGQSIISDNSNGNIQLDPNGTGEIVFLGNTSHGDSIKAQFGDADDLQIYHDGSNSYIVDAGTGNLNLQADNNINILNNAGTEFKAQFITDGAVNLFYDNSKKLATTATGVDVTGTVTADGVHSEYNGVSDNMTTSPTASGVQIGSFTNGYSAVEIAGTAGGFIDFSSADGTDFDGRILYAHSDDTMKFYTSGTIEAMRLDSSGSVGIGTTTVDSLLHLQKSDATTYSATATDGQVGVGPTIYLENPANSNATVGGQIVFGMRSTEAQARIGATGGASPALVFGTNDAERLRIDSSGNVGIGTTSPSSYGRLAVMTPTATYGYFGIGNSVGGGGGVNIGSYYGTTKISYIDTVLENGTPSSEQSRLQFATISGGTLAERMRIDHIGQVGLSGNTTSFNTTGSVNGLQLHYQTSSGQATIGSYSAGGGTALAFHTNTGGGASTEAMRILSDGKVAIGSTSSLEKLRVVGNIEVYNDNVDGYIWFHDNGTRSWSIGSDYSTGNFAITNQSNLASGHQLLIDSSGNVLPGANGTQDLGSASLRWQNIYTSDLNLNNGVGNYTVVEGEEDLFLYNNKSGKVFKFALIEVDPSEATPKIEDLKNGD